MTDDSAARARNRTHAIVEGALLGDIAIVFLLMRAFFPFPPVRALIKAVAVIPFVLLTQRRGVKIAVLAALASYILFSALVGPLLAIAAIDVAVGAILIGISRRLGIGPVFTTLWVGVVYTVLDLIIPTIASIIIFRYPISKLEKGADNAVSVTFKFGYWVLQHAQAPADVLARWHSWQGPVTDHWVVAWLGLMVLYGMMLVYLAVLVSQMVLRQIPEQAFSAEEAAA
jgi:hypothetical protein